MTPITTAGKAAETTRCARESTSTAATKFVIVRGSITASAAATAATPFHAVTRATVPTDAAATAVNSWRAVTDDCTRRCAAE